jgi:prepilin-type N-terminal cleavage/methylation domain-containing protein
MMRSAAERGFTLIEVLVAMSISMVVMGCVVAILTVFLNDNRYATLRDDATAHAQTMIDRLSHDLRDAASPTPASAGLLAHAASYDIAFQMVSAKPGSAPSGDPTNQMWVRYCLDGNDTLWRQTTAPSSSISTVPDLTACPSTSSPWLTGSGGKPCCVQLSDVVNEIGGDNRPLFTFGPTGYSGLSEIKSVQTSLYVDRNPGHLPGPTELTSAVYLRNELAPPVANFVPTKTAVSGGADISLNGSLSTDPNGQVLTYQWYEGSSCSSPSVALTGGTTQEFDAGDFPNGSYSFALLVTNTGGLSTCSSPQTVTVP